jgi:hypothetical protein
MSTAADTEPHDTGFVVNGQLTNQVGDNAPCPSHNYPVWVLRRLRHHVAVGEQIGGYRTSSARSASYSA